MSGWTGWTDLTGWTWEGKNNPVEPEPLIPKHGGYRKLKSFQNAQLCTNVTVRFCDRTISPRSRTHDQMVQAARSGEQNIAEGSKASGTSKKSGCQLYWANGVRGERAGMRMGVAVLFHIRVGCRGDGVRGESGGVV